MSLSSETARNDYEGNNSTGTYSYTFRVFDETHVRPVVRDPNTDVETPLTLTTHFTVTDINNPNGGTIVLVAGFDWMDGANLDDDWALAIRRVVPLTQETDVRNQGAYFPEIHENEFDLLVMIDQQQQDELDRSVKLPETISGVAFDTTLPNEITNPGSYLIVNNTGDGFSLATGGSSADFERVFGSGTYASLKADALVTPALQRFGFATDLHQFAFYCADTAEGDDGWFLMPQQIYQP